MSMYSLDPELFNEAAEQIAEYERRKEWSLLHGDGEVSEDRGVEQAQQTKIDQGVKNP